MVFTSVCDRKGERTARITTSRGLEVVALTNQGLFAAIENKTTICNPYTNDASKMSLLPLYLFKIVDTNHVQCDTDVGTC